MRTFTECRRGGRDWRSGRGLPAARSLLCAAFALVAAWLVEGCHVAGDKPGEGPESAAFSQPMPGLAPMQVAQFVRGRELFSRVWQVAPGEDDETDGLGPVYNQPSCADCHPRDGRGHPPRRKGEPMSAMLIRLSLPGTGVHGGPRPVPGYGDQLNDTAVPGVPAEGRVFVDYDAIKGKYGDGEPFILRKPTYLFHRLAFGQFDDDVMISPRVPPALIGLGLLEDIPEAAILAHADPLDSDRDGISGRPNMVWDKGDQARVIGRFGWKANQPSVRQQVALALAADIGITSPLYSEENCPAVQTACRAAPSGGEPEAGESTIDLLTLYARALAVPARRGGDDPVVARGEALFASAGCAACHVPRMLTSARRPSSPRERDIQPFTDLLLHDMGEGLADGRPEFEATGREWRTPPLWGIGLLGAVNRHTLLLHDGRARNPAEAILWHGGEAEAAKEAFRTMAKGDRAALLAFLNTL